MTKGMEKQNSWLERPKEGADPYLVSTYKAGGAGADVFHDRHPRFPRVLDNSIKQWLRN